MKKIITLVLMMFSTYSMATEEISLKDIQFKDVNNQPVTLTQYQGKKVYAKIWASWCPICLAGLAEIDEISADKNKNFEVITIVSPNHKGEKSTQDFIDWYKGLDYKNITVLLDEQGEVIKRAKIRGYPSNITLNENLVIQKSLPGHLGAEQIYQLFSK